MSIFKLRYQIFREEISIFSYNTCFKVETSNALVVIGRFYEFAILCVVEISIKLTKFIFIEKFFKKLISVDFYELLWHINVFISGNVSGNFWKPFPAVSRNIFQEI